MTIKRFATIMGAALLAIFPLAAPAHASAGTYTCETGVVHDMTDAPGFLHVGGYPCRGYWWSATDATVTIETGPAAGTYFCDFVFSYEGTNVGGYYCVPV